MGMEVAAMGMEEKAVDSVAEDRLRVASYAQNITDTYHEWDWWLQSANRTHLDLECYPHSS